MKKTHIVGSIAALALIVCLSGCAVPDFSVSNVEKTVFTDPHKGWVQVWPDDNAASSDYEKRCDGTTMVYRNSYNGDVTAIPDDTECA